LYSYVGVFERLLAFFLEGDSEGWKFSLPAACEYERSL
jgi:hypothetical protein